MNNKTPEIYVFVETNECRATELSLTATYIFRKVNFGNKQTHKLSGTHMVKMKKEEKFVVNLMRAALPELELVFFSIASCSSN